MGSGHRTLRASPDSRRPQEADGASPERPRKGETSGANAGGARIEQMHDPALDQHRRKILELAARRGASNIRIFGSAARGEALPASDLDLLVSFEAGRTLLDLIGLKHDLEELIDRPVDVVTDRALSPYLRDRVLAEAVPL